MTKDEIIGSLKHIINCIDVYEDWTTDIIKELIEEIETKGIKQ